MTTSNKKDEILEMVRAGMTDPVAISDELRVTVYYVRKVLREEGVDLPRKTVFNVIGVEAVGMICEDYLKNVKTKDILQKYGIDYNTLYKVLEAENIPLRRVSDSNNTNLIAAARRKRVDHAVQLYIDGAPVSEITKETGVHQPSLHYELSKRGIPLRTSKGKELREALRPKNTDLP